jgi:phage tail protein X
MAYTGLTSIVTTLAGDTMDLLCWRNLGTTSGGVVELAYTLNPNMSELGPVLPAAIDVILPVIPAQPPTLETISLWT